MFLAFSSNAIFIVSNISMVLKKKFLKWPGKSQRISLSCLSSNPVLKLVENSQFWNESILIKVHKPQINYQHLNTVSMEQTGMQSARRKHLPDLKKWLAFENFLKIDPPLLDIGFSWEHKILYISLKD